MKTTGLLRFALTLFLLGLLAFARAEDVDIYSQNATNTGVPNVLLVLDNAANFSASAANCTYSDGTAPSLNGTAGGIEQCAIYNVVSGLPAGAINLGLMVFNDNNMRDINGANCGGSNGGCLTVPLTLMSGTAKTNFLAWVKSWRTTGGAGAGYIKASGEATAATMQESWAYYAGNTGLSGRAYTAPPAGCQKNFVIYIGNAFDVSGTPGDGGSASPSASLAGAPGVTTAQLSPITIPSGTYGTSAFSCSGTYSMPKHTDSSGLYADEWTRYMNQIDLYSAYSGTQGITTYAVGLLGTSCKPDYPALMTSMALYGGGKYFATSSYSDISTAILKILNEVQAVNSVFASASLPVSVNATGTYLNQIYLGMFRPDASGNPRWLGNLKQYQFILQYNDPANPNPNNATLTLGDALGNPALSSAGTGFLAPTAQSFWTYKNTALAPDSTGGFFINDSKGVGTTYDLPDGEFVEKGGVAQQIRDTYLTVNYSTTPSSPRKVYTYCPSGSGCVADLTDVSNQFTTTNSAITDAMLSAAKTTAVSSLTRGGTTAAGNTVPGTTAIVDTTLAHGFLTGDTITVSGATQTEYNGTKASITVTSPTQFTFSVVENPPSPATGSYTASVPSNPKPVSSLVRSVDASGNAIAIATVSNHGYVTGQQITIANATEARYNGTQVITKIDANTFSYVITEGPFSPAGGGNVLVGGVIKAVIEASNAKPTPGAVRAAGSTLVTVTTTQPHGLGVGNTVTMQGVTDGSGNAISQYNNIAFLIGVPSNKTFTFNIDAKYITPASPDSSTTITADVAVPKTISSLTRVGSTATATAAGHGFSSGALVSVGGTYTANEGAYVGTWTISNVTTNTFDYGPVALTPVTPATGNIVVSKAGVSDRTSLINWVRGENNFGDEPNPGFGYTVRESVHGDVLHSRPAVVNYGDSRGLVVFYGDNQGMYRAVNADQTAAIGTVQAGAELWSLVLPEHYPKLARQRVNDPELKFPSTALLSAQPKDYFVDGLTGTYIQYGANLAVSRAYIYPTMRRGGRFIYALDVTNPVAPVVLWKINTSTAGFAELGQTWSRPQLTLLKGYVDASGNPKPVLVFGAGYDNTNEDVEPPTADAMGRGIYVVDAATGALVWRATSPADTSACPGTASCLSVAGMNWSLPSDVTFLDRDNDGLIDRIYASDVGGNIWRVDLEPLASGLPSTWQVTKLAALGCATGTCASGVSPRKFFFSPSVVQVGVTGGAASYDAVLLGSGDREHPLISTNVSSEYFVTNRFYMLKDTQTGKNANSPSAWTTLTEASLFDATTVNYDGSGSGFYVTFATGEKAVNQPITSRGTTYFGTNTPIPPSANSCSSNLGLAKSYAINPFTGGYVTTNFAGGGMPPSPVAGIVTMTLPDGTPFNQSFCIGCGGSTALSPVDPSKKVPKAPRRAYWYKK